MDKRTLLLNCALYIVMAFLFNQSNHDYRSFVWFALVSNFSIGLIAILVLFVSSLVPWTKDSVKYAIQSAVSIVPLGMFHLFAALFLSFFASWGGVSALTSNNNLKSEISWEELSSLLFTYSPYYFPYLFTKLTLFSLPKSTLYGGFVFVRDAIILVAASVIVPLIVLKWAESSSIDRNSASFYGIALFLFVPWSIFFGRDIFEHKNDKVYLFKATTQFPVKVIEKGPQGWGFLFMIFGLIFILVSLAAFTTKLSQQWYLSLIFFPPFFLVGSLFFIVGLNMQWGLREITISQTEVNGRVRLLIPWVKQTYWQQSLIDYQRPSKHTKRHKGDQNSSAHSTYEVRMNLKIERPKKKFSFEPDRNIVLYRAYHEDDLDQELAVYRQLFAFMEK